MQRQQPVVLVFAFALAALLIIPGCGRHGDEIPGTGQPDSPQAEIQDTDTTPGSPTSQTPSDAETSDTTDSRETPGDQSWAEMLNLDEPAPAESRDARSDGPPDGFVDPDVAPRSRLSVPRGPAGRSGQGSGPPPDIPTFDPKSFIQRHDTNNDGVLTRDELSERWEGLSKNADTNGDGRITSAELENFQPSWIGPREGGRPQAPRGQREQGGQQQRGSGFDRLDENSDGRLTSQELPERLWERLREADANGDGAISRQEYEDFRATRPDDGRERSNRPDRQRR